jgi:hypothetical protein
MFKRTGLEGVEWNAVAGEDGELRWIEVIFIILVIFIIVSISRWINIDKQWGDCFVFWKYLGMEEWEEGDHKCIESEGSSGKKRMC